MELRVFQKIAAAAPLRSSNTDLISVKVCLHSALNFVEVVRVSMERELLYGMIE